MNECCSYKNRVDERRAYETRGLTRAVYAAAAGLGIIDVAMAVFVAVYLGGLK